MGLQGHTGDIHNLWEGLRAPNGHLLSLAQNCPFLLFCLTLFPCQNQTAFIPPEYFLNETRDSHRFCFSFSSVWAYPVHTCKRAYPRGRNPVYQIVLFVSPYSTPYFLKGTVYQSGPCHENQVGFFDKSLSHCFAIPDIYTVFYGADIFPI